MMVSMKALICYVDVDVDVDVDVIDNRNRTRTRTASLFHRRDTYLTQHVTEGAEFNTKFRHVNSGKRSKTSPHAILACIYIGFR